MLKITLYKDCILNEKYEEVFSLGKKLIDGELDEYSVLERYLLSLTKRVIEIPFTYYENSGQLVFEYDISSDNIYEYNYMKIEERDDEVVANIRLIRYCFVNKIEIKNDFVYLEYKEDIWSSYADKIKGTTTAFLSKSRFLDYDNIDTTLHRLPVAYDGNDMLRILVDENRVMTKVNIYAQIQLVELDSQGNPTKNFNSYIVRLKFIENTSVTWTRTTVLTDNYWYLKFINSNYENYIATYEYAQILNYLMLNQSEYNKAYYSDEKYYQIETPLTPKYMSYQIGKIWCVPYEWEVEEDFESSENLGFIIFNGDHSNPFDESISFSGNVSLIGKIVNYQRGQFNEFKEYTIDNDFTNLMLGTFKTQVEFQNNGTDLDLVLLGYVDNYNFTILMNVEGNIIDITEDFEINVPFTTLNSSETKQLEIARAIKNENLGYQRTKNELSFMKASNQAGKNFISATGKKSSVGAIGQAIGAVLDQSIAFGSLIADYMHETDMKIFNNLPVFSTTKSAFSSSSNILNGIYGLLIFRMTLDNEEFVKAFINKFGYIVFNFINDIGDLGINNPPMFQGESCNYNAVKFEAINLYGSFTREIAITLNNILLNGVKIWYDEGMSEDSYVI